MRARMKVKPVIPRIVANRDADDSIDHYMSENSAQAGLGFINALERAYAHIARHPGTDPLPVSGAFYRA